MTARTLTPHPAVAGWQDRADGGPIAVAERPAIGTTARLAVWPPDRVADCADAVDGVLDVLDRQASRFRPDSELSQVQRSSSTVFLVSEGFSEALDAALRAARWTGGLVDPTVGAALEALGYDRDFATIDQDAAASGGAGAGAASGAAAGGPAPGWEAVRLSGRLLERPPGVRLDLGATAKGLGADRAAAAAAHALGTAGGVLVSLGGDLAVAGTPPEDGWPVAVVEDPDQPDDWPTQVVRLTEGALATSSPRCRTWRHGTRLVHHLIDPRTGDPADSPWRTATVAAPNCLTANAASTAVMVGGRDAADWLEDTELPARLVAADGTVRRFGAWPATDDGLVDVSWGSALALPSGTRGYRR